MEQNGNGKKLNQAGWYKHKETGQVVKLEENPGIGTPMIDAFVQVGFVRIDDSEVPSVPVVSEEDEYTEKETKNGTIQYRKNGKLISKDEYENNK